MKRITVDVVTDADDGTAVVFSGHTRGKIHSVSYLKDGTTPFTDGVDFTITVEDTGETIWTQTNVNASVTKYPRAAVHDTAGAALLYAAGGTAQSDKVALSSDRIKVAIAQGGNSKLGKFIFLVDDE